MGSSNTYIRQIRDFVMKEVKEYKLEIEKSLSNNDIIAVFHNLRKLFEYKNLFDGYFHNLPQYFPYT